MAVIIPVDTYMKGINMNVQLITSLDEVVPLLAAADLPSSDLADKDNLVMFGIYDNNRLIASAAGRDRERFLSSTRGFDRPIWV